MSSKTNLSNINNPEHLPGPGSYDSNREDISKRSKSYSMGLKFSRHVAGVTSIPGPGAYDIEKSDQVRTSGGIGTSTGAQFSFPKDSRNITKEVERKSQELPDPTSYSPKLT